MQMFVLMFMQYTTVDKKRSGFPILQPSNAHANSCELHIIITGGDFFFVAVYKMYLPGFNRSSCE